LPNPDPMEAFEIIVKTQPYKVIRDNINFELFKVFNHAIFYTITKNSFGVWEKVEHRFGPDEFPIGEIGDQIDRYYDYPAYGRVIGNS
jgi:hypothetical protein